MNANSILGLPLDILVQVDGLLGENGRLVDLAEKLLMLNWRLSQDLFCTIPVLYIIKLLKSLVTHSYSVYLVKTLI